MNVQFIKQISLHVRMRKKQEETDRASFAGRNKRVEENLRN